MSINEFKNVMPFEKNKVYNMDCLEYMKQVPDDYFDLVLTDPPYGINMSKSTNIENKKKGFSGGENFKAKEWDKNRPSKEYFDEILRISKNQIIFGGNYFIDYLYPSRGWIYWSKKNNKTQGSFFADGELAWTSIDTNTRDYTFGWIGVDYINNRENDIKLHPTQKPLKLFQTIITDFYPKGEFKTVFDPFMGSGTTAIACKSLGLDFYGTELDKDYCEIIEKRLKAVQGSLF